MMFERKPYDPFDEQKKLPEELQPKNARGVTKEDLDRLEEFEEERKA